MGRRGCPLPNSNLLVALGSPVYRPAFCTVDTYIACCCRASRSRHRALTHGGHCSRCFGHIRNKIDKNSALEELTFWQVCAGESHINKSCKEADCINVGGETFGRWWEFWNDVMDAVPGVRGECAAI